MSKNPQKSALAKPSASPVRR